MRIRAVAPQTVSPGSSKNAIGRQAPPELPELLPVGVRVEQLRDRDRERQRPPPAGRARSTGGAAEQADERGDRELGRDGAEAVELAGHLDRVRRPARSPRWPPAAPRRSSDASPGSRLPPGNAISPRCDGIVSGRFVRIDVRLAVAPRTARTSTARGATRRRVELRLARRRQHRRAGSRTSASVKTRGPPVRGPPTAPARPVAAPGGRGICWRPPRPRPRSGGPRSSRRPSRADYRHAQSTRRPGGR